MTREQFANLLLLALILVVFYLCYRVLEPFLVPLAWAAVLAVLFHPLHARLRRRLKGRDSLSALLITLLVVVLVLGPISSVGTLLVRELAETYRSLEAQVRQGQIPLLEGLRHKPWVAALLDWIHTLIQERGVDLQEALLGSARQLSTRVLNQAAEAVRDVSRFLLNTILTLFALYYLLKDGEKLVNYLREVLPLPPTKKSYVFLRLQDVVGATMYGGVVVAAIQGTLGGLGFWVLGLPSPVLWGTVMAFLAFLPLVGPWLVWVPAAVWLGLQGSVLKAVVLLAWGGIAVGLVDNVLRPVLIGTRAGLHSLLVFFSILGGIAAFGFVGIVAGPLVMAVALAVLDLFRLETQE